MTDHQIRLALSVSLAGLLGGCATNPQATLTIRNVGDTHVTTSDESAIERGKMLLARGQSADAISAFRAALRQEQDSAEAHNGLAIAYDRIGRKDLARRYFELAYAEKPQVDRYRNNLARHFEKTGQPELARGLAQAPMAVAVVAEPVVATPGVFVPEPVVIAAVDSELPAVATDSQIDAIVADFSASRFVVDEAVLQTPVADANWAELAHSQIGKSEFAVYRPSVATAIEAVPISLPSGPMPDQYPKGGTTALIADLPRDNRKSEEANSPYIERVSLGEVKLVTFVQPKAPTAEPEFHLSNRQIAFWVDEEKRKGQFQNGDGLRGRLAIQSVVERIAIEEAITSATSLAALVEQMDKDFVYIAFDDAADAAETEVT